MVSWQAFAPRRARDPEAWLQAKGIKTREDLLSALAELKIDPSTFPESVAESYLRSQETKQQLALGETRPLLPDEDPAAPSIVQDSHLIPSRESSMSIDDTELTDFAWVSDSLESITVVVDRVAITLSIDEFFQLRKDIETVVSALETSREVQLCSYEDEDRVMRYMLTPRSDAGEDH